MSNLPKANIPISESCWDYWNQKRLDCNDQRPPMPKVLPQTSKIIYDPPWLWDEEHHMYIQNVMNWSRALVNQSKDLWPDAYDAERDYGKGE